VKVFITGITGLLGRHVAQLCVREGYEVTALVRNRNVNHSQFQHDLTICYGDLTNVHSIPESLNGAEIIIHCAADTSMGARSNSKQEQTNINGLQNLISIAKKVNIKRFIHVSTANTIVYGDAARPADESIKFTTAPVRLPYINTKIMGEEMLLNEYKIHGFPVIILNPTFILGPYDYNLSSGKLIWAIMQKRLFLYPSGGKNIVDVRDVAQVAVNAINKGKIGHNYLICNENLTYKEIISRTCETAKITFPKIRMPYFMGIVIGNIGSFIEYMTGRLSPINSKTIKITFENHYYRADKAKNELGFTPRFVSETIQDTVNWFKNEHIPHQRSR
jgi:dihydroflavonol-4-reductase